MRALAAGDIGFERAEQIVKTTRTVEDVAHLDIAGISRLVAREKHLTRVDEQDAYAGRYLTMQPNLDQSRWQLWGQLAGLDGAIVQDALFAKADTFPTESRDDSRATRNADALVAISQDSLTSNGEDGASASGPELVVFVDARSGSATNGYVPAGPIVGPNTIDEILCGSGGIDLFVYTKEGAALDVGRKSPKIPKKLRRAVLGRDDGCCADGCTSRYRLQPHHRKHWKDGGPTDAENLDCYCWFHHHVVIHQRGFVIDPTSPRQRTRFVRPDPSTPD